MYIVSSPFIPELELLFYKKTDKNSGFIYKTELAEKADVSIENLKPAPNDDRLIIPEIGVDSKIVEGEDIGILSQGEAWRRPLTSTPSEGGNTVIVGHRFFGQGKNTFYHLNKLRKDDIVIIYWKGREYDYEVTEVFETVPENIEVESATSESMLTLYTCSGLSAEKRFIVKARLIDNDEGLS